MTQSPEPIVDSSAEPTAIFRRDGERLLPQLFAQGPWNPNHLHGGAICGVLARAIERCASPVPMRVARMTIEMTRWGKVVSVRANEATRPWRVLLRGVPAVRSIESGAAQEDALGTLLIPDGGATDLAARL